VKKLISLYNALQNSLFKQEKAELVGKTCFKMNNFLEDEKLKPHYEINQNILQ
jgi:hypothetical protein